MASQIMIPSFSRLFESIYCYQWYVEHQPEVLHLGVPIDESLCKLDPIQQSVSSLRGWMEWWNAIPALVLAIPFGILADQLGRRWILRLSISAIFLRYLWVVFVCASGIPMNAVYFASVLNVFCGGDAVAEMLFCVILTDVTPGHLLPTVFFRLNAVSQFCKVLGPALCGLLLRLGPWYPLSIALAFLLLASLLSFMIPETLTKAEIHDVDVHSAAPSTVSRVRSTWSAFGSGLAELGIIWTDYRILFVASLYPFRMMSIALDELLQRYVSLRYAIPLANATFLYSLQACVATLVLFLALPAVASWMDDHLGLSAIRKNVLITKISLVLLALGYTIDGLAPTLAVLIVGLLIQTMGSGVSSALRSLVGALVKQEDNGRVFSGMAISETLSTMAVYPISAALFNRGIALGGHIHLGLPFYTTGAAVLVMAGLMCLVRFERRTIAETEPS